MKSITRSYRYVYNSLSKLIAIILEKNNKCINRSELLEQSEYNIKYGKVNTYEPSKPLGPEPTPTELVKKNRQLIDPDFFISKVSNVVLIGPIGLSINTQGKYILEQTDGKYKNVARGIIKTMYRGEMPVKNNSAKHIKHPVISLVGLRCKGYFHWFADYLPRIRGAEIYSKKTGIFPLVIIPENPPSWMKKSLHYVGVPKHNILQLDRDRLLIDTLIIPSLPRFTESDSPEWGFTQSPEALKWTSNQIRSDLGITQGCKNRILITRRQASERRIYNETEVIKLLHKYGFEAVNLNSWSYEDQVQLFANAEIIIAPHGAGLINSIYSDDVAILEMFGKKTNACYYTVAGGLDFRYRYKLCDEIDGDLLVDISSLERDIKTYVD